ncbi:MAG: hypothetical protein IT259_07540 [Saprospiraceae bacterium]|nr:hypothetical protein [Saprospiraceae bacterium]
MFGKAEAKKGKMQDSAARVFAASLFAHKKSGRRLVKAATYETHADQKISPEAP